MSGLRARSSRTLGAGIGSGAPRRSGVDCVVDADRSDGQNITRSWSMTAVEHHLVHDESDDVSVSQSGTVGTVGQLRRQAVTPSSCRPLTMDDHETGSDNGRVEVGCTVDVTMVDATGGVDVTMVDATGGVDVTGVDVTGGVDVKGVDVTGGVDVKGVDVKGVDVKGVDVTIVDATGGVDVKGVDVTGGVDVTRVDVTGGVLLKAMVCEVAGREVTGDDDVTSCEPTGGEVAERFAGGVVDESVTARVTGRVVVDARGVGDAAAEPCAAALDTMEMGVWALDRMAARHWSMVRPATTFETLVAY